MNNVVQLNPAASTVVVPRPYRDVVTALNLDAIRLPDDRSRRTKTASPAASASPAANDAVIPELSRNVTLASIAGGLRRRGLSQAAILAELQAQNHARCQPPLDDDEVERIAQSISRYAPATAAGVMSTLNDTGNANRFAATFSDQIRYVPERRKWLIWEGQRWVVDTVGQITEMSKRVAQNIYDETAVAADDAARKAIAQHARSSLQAQRLKAMVELAQSIPELVAPVATLDADDMLLGVENGVVDLRTGQLRDATREDLITRQAPVCFDPEAKCPRFRKFLRRVMQNDPSLIGYLQRVSGYSLTGKTGEQCLFFLYGHGANGKSTYLRVMLDLLGDDYALQTPSETLMAKRFNSGSGPSSDLARLHNIRLTTANEVEDGSLLAESLIKQLTGGDPITARFLFENHFDFIPKVKLFIAGNHKPIIKGDDYGIWRRIHLIPFEVQIPEAERDPKLPEKLRQELPGILNWVIQGCLKWQKSGLQVPLKIRDAVKEYRDEMDIMAQWIDERCEFDPNAEWQAAAAYRCYKTWAEQSGFKPMNSTAFGRKFSERFQSKRTNTGKVYQGIKERPWSP
jgi:putative DNA primase/helicase